MDEVAVKLDEPVSGLDCMRLFYLIQLRLKRVEFALE